MKPHETTTFLRDLPPFGVPGANQAIQCSKGRSGTQQPDLFARQGYPCSSRAGSTCQRNLADGGCIWL